MDDGAATLAPRQIWAVSTSSNILPHTCTPTLLSSGAHINIGQGTIITLTQHAAYQPPCPGTPVPEPIDPTRPDINLEDVFGKRVPFYTSTSPQVYAIAAATAVSYMLVIMLFITPRTFFVGGVGGGGGFLGSRGMTGGSYGNNPVIGVGSRPWLQKAATLAVAISLTIVTADTFKWAERQYNQDYQDAMELSSKVIDGLEIRIVRVISETFLWLAQAQTLIRLFPRHKEKLIIKWTAFGLITLELIFSILNFFTGSGGGHAHPRRFNNAIPAMDYLFALTLNLCYASFVFYYALVKRRFAFIHPNMRNMPLVAFLSVVAVLIPVIFFILDLSEPDVSGWGGYVRWVGAAAASVVVWEWVERIEALERDEKKDGILGREIFDGDEMLEANPSSDSGWTGSSRKNLHHGGGDAGGFGSGLSTGWNNLASRTRTLRRHIQPQQRHTAQRTSRTSSGPLSVDTDIAVGQTTRVRTLQAPAPVASPISRADTTSAASTVYRVRYHPVSEPTPPILEVPLEDQPTHPQPDQLQDGTLEPRSIIVADSSLTSRVLANGFSRMLHPFKRQRDSPPLEVAQAISSNPQLPSISSSMQPQTSFLRRLHLTKSQRAEAPPKGTIVIPAPQQRNLLPNVEESSNETNDDNHELGQHPSQDYNPAPSSTNHPGPPSRRNTQPDVVLQVLNSPAPSSLSNPSPLQHRQVVSPLSSTSPHPNTPTPYGLSPVAMRNTPVISEEREDEHAQSDSIHDHSNGAHNDTQRRTDHDR